MKTSLQVSTISYNSSDYLRDRLDELVSAGILSFYAFIPHLGEGGDKNHIHLLCIPARLTDFDALKKHFYELDPLHPKPLGVTRWVKTKQFRDWYLYGLHDRMYLALKGEAKEFVYSPEDFVVSDDDIMRELVAECDVCPGDCTYHAIKVMVEDGYTWHQVLCSGYIPTRHIMQARELFAAFERELALARAASLSDSSDQIDDDLPDGW